MILFQLILLSLDLFLCYIRLISIFLQTSIVQYMLPSLVSLVNYPQKASSSVGLQCCPVLFTFVDIFINTGILSSLSIFICSLFFLACTVAIIKLNRRCARRLDWHKWHKAQCHLISEHGVLLIHTYGAPCTCSVCSTKK